VIFVYAIVSPGSDLDGETWDFQATTRTAADARATSKLIDTFGYSSPARKVVTSLRFVGEHVDRRTYEGATQSGISITNGDADAVVATLLNEDLRAAGAR
jgi:hypothetical protein